MGRGSFFLIDYSGIERHDHGGNRPEVESQINIRLSCTSWVLPMDSLFPDRKQLIVRDFPDKMLSQIGISLLDAALFSSENREEVESFEI